MENFEGEKNEEDEREGRRKREGTCCGAKFPGPT